jgi:hypothetical protein
MLYYNKYLKYKNKYLQLKNQHGGYVLDLSEWTKIENLGQQNCGIFESIKYPNYILKCNLIQSKLQKDVEIINQSIKLFPTIIDSTVINEDGFSKQYITMEKLNGDITSIFFDLFPKKVLQDMIAEHMINEEQSKNIFTLFLGKCSKTFHYSKELQLDINKFTLNCLQDPEIYTLYIEYIKANPDVILTNHTFTIKEIEYTNWILSIKQEEENFKDLQSKILQIQKITNITLDLYDSFISKLTDLWSVNFEIIMKEIIKIKLLLAKLDYSYNDNKLDNYGYILLETKIIDEETSRQYNTPKIFNKYLYVYFLDFDSGLYKYKNPDDKLNEINHMIKVYNNKNYAVNGQYSLKTINSNKLRMSQDISLDTFTTNNNINPEIIQILQKEYSFNLIPFKHTFSNIEEMYDYIK